MHPWVRALHRNAMEAVREDARRPPKVRPNEPRERRKMGWMTDHGLKRLRAELLAQPMGPGREAQRVLYQIELEEADRALEAKLVLGNRKRELRERLDGPEGGDIEKSAVIREELERLAK